MVTAASAFVMSVLAYRTFETLRHEQHLIAGNITVEHQLTDDEVYYTGVQVATTLLGMLFVMRIGWAVITEAAVGLQEWKRKMDEASGYV